MLTESILDAEAKNIARDVKNPAASHTYTEADIVAKIINTFAQWIRPTAEDFKTLQERATAAENEAERAHRKAVAFVNRNKQLEAVYHEIGKQIKSVEATSVKE